MKTLTTGTGKNKEIIFVNEDEKNFPFASRTYPPFAKKVTKVTVYGPRAVQGTQDDYWRLYKNMAIAALGYEI